MPAVVRGDGDPTGLDLPDQRARPPPAGTKGPGRGVGPAPDLTARAV
jgi:hypothetical protein